MSALRKRMIKELELQRKSPHTIKAYVAAVKQLAVHFNRCPTSISCKEVRDYIHHLITVKKLSVASVNVKLAGLVFLYRRVLGDAQFDLKIYSKPKRKLPEPFTRQEITRIFDATSNLKHRVMFMTAYAGGLRSFEVTQLQARDIRSDQMLIHVRSGKGDKDRFTLLSHRLLKELRSYWQQYRPGQWLFESNDGRQYAPKTLQSAFTNAKARAGVQRAGGIHGLRHSFATHLLENGMDIFTIKRLLGHTSMKTTSGYLHVTRRHMQSINNPMDLLNQSASDQP